MSDESSSGELKYRPMKPTPKRRRIVNIEFPDISLVEADREEEGGNVTEKSSLLEDWGNDCIADCSYQTQNLSGNDVAMELLAIEHESGEEQQIGGFSVVDVETGTSLELNCKLISSEFLFCSDMKLNIRSPLFIQF